MSRPQSWTSRALLRWMGDAFTAKDIDSPRLCAEMLLAHTLGVERLKLYMDPDRPATPDEREALRDLVKRALAHEPIQYLVGEAWFYGLPMRVDRRVLIPRPCTQLLVERVVDHLKQEPGVGSPVLVDVCTGSGAVAIALASQLPDARVLATDVSAEALEVAAINAERHGVADRVELLEGDLLGPLRSHPGVTDGSLHALVANPPYIPDHEWADVAPNVKDHEPTLALRGGGDGLDLVRPLLEGAGALLRPGGMLVVETAASTARASAEIAESVGGFGSVRVVKDLEGLERAVVAVRARRA